MYIFKQHNPIKPLIKILIELPTIPNDNQTQVLKILTQNPNKRMDGGKSLLIEKL